MKTESISGLVTNVFFYFTRVDNFLSFGFIVCLFWLGGTLIETITLSFFFIKLRALMLKDFICDKGLQTRTSLMVTIFLVLFSVWFSLVLLTYSPQKMLNGHIYIYIYK